MIDPLRIDLDTFSQRLSVRMRFIVCWVSGKFPSNSNFQFRFASKKNYDKHFSTRFGIIFHLIFRLRGLSMESRARIHSEKQLSIHLALTTQQRVSRLSKALWCEKIERETARATCWIASRLYITISTAWVSFSLGERKHYRKNVFPHSKFALLSLTVVALTNTVAQNFSWMEWGGRGLDWLDGKIKSQNPVSSFAMSKTNFPFFTGMKTFGKTPQTFIYFWHLPRKSSVVYVPLRHQFNHHDKVLQPLHIIVNGRADHKMIHHHPRCSSSPGKNYFRSRKIKNISEFHFDGENYVFEISITPSSLVWSEKKTEKLFDGVWQLEWDFFFFSFDGILIYVFAFSFRPLRSASHMLLFPLVGMFLLPLPVRHFFRCFPLLCWPRKDEGIK